LKKVIKKILHRLYLVGLNEEILKKNERRTDEINGEATVGEGVVFGPGARVMNHQLDKSKVKVGKSSIIMGDLLTFNHGGEIAIGEYCFLGEQSRIWSAGKISIGDRVLISHNVNIHDNNSHSLDPQVRNREFIYSYTHHSPMPNSSLPASEIVIEDDVWIGFNSTILKGVRIGRGAIIGACSLITADVPPHAVIIGNPARIIKFTA
jgi:acetyltransferase-like isoleucine patch superfamily enzyme